MHFVVAVKIYKRLSAAYNKMGTYGNGPISCQEDKSPCICIPVCRRKPLQYTDLGACFTPPTAVPG